MQLYNKQLNTVLVMLLYAQQTSFAGVTNLKFTIKSDVQTTCCAEKTDQTYHKLHYAQRYKHTCILATVTGNEFSGNGNG